MEPDIASGLIALGGSLVGGLATYAATRIDRRWRRAEKCILRLCEQVAAYYELEQLYKDELAHFDTSRSSRAILLEMRTRVSASGQFERPLMTTLGARKLQREWQ